MFKYLSWLCWYLSRLFGLLVNWTFLHFVYFEIFWNYKVGWIFFFFNDFVLRLTIKWSQICILTLFFLHKNQQNWLETECYFSGMTRPKNVSILFLFDISNEFYVKYLLSALVFKLCHMQSFTLLHLLHDRWRKIFLCIVF